MNSKPGVTLLAVSLAVVLGGCTKTVVQNVVAPASPSSSVGAASSSPTAPPKPKLADARLDGIYSMTYRLIRSTVPISHPTNHSTWAFVSRCHTGGGCNAVLKSSNKWKTTASFVNGHYKFAHSINRYWTCSSGSTITYYMNDEASYNVQVGAMKLINGQWVATRLKGVIFDKANRGCGFSGAPTDQFSISGKLRHSP